MDTCFLFTKNLDASGCYCLKLTQAGKLSSPPAQHSFEEIRALQTDCYTLIVESSESACMLDLQLPWLPERKARIAIPYALEDKLAQPIEELHFAFDKQRYQNKAYLVTVLSKQRINYIMNVLNEQNIEYEAITADWFALAPQEMVIADSSLLVNMDDFKGTLSGNLAEAYLQNHPANSPLIFPDSNLAVDSSLQKEEELSCIWIARRLAKSEPLNLCQGEMQHGTGADWIKKGYQVAGVLFCTWLLSLLVVNMLHLHFLNKKTSTIDTKIEVIYHQFFPEAKQVISPKFRISQLLGSNSDTQAHFWFLLNQFAKGMEGAHLTVEQMRYQNKTLFVTLTSADFQSLELIENKLKQLQVKVRQTQASTREQQVVATLELT